MWNEWSDAPSRSLTILHRWCTHAHKPMCSHRFCQRISPCKELECMCWFGVVAGTSRSVCVLGSWRGLLCTSDTYYATPPGRGPSTRCAPLSQHTPSRQARGRACLWTVRAMRPLHTADADGVACCSLHVDVSFINYTPSGRQTTVQHSEGPTLMRGASNHTA